MGARPSARALLSAVAWRRGASGYPASAPLRCHRPRGRGAATGLRPPGGKRCCRPGPSSISWRPAARPRSLTPTPRPA
eukprot:5505369-Alexandrium_andersonii.AAC.1